MGRFLGASPPSSSGAAGRRYEALPADHDDRDDHSDRESLGAETASPAAATANPAPPSPTTTITSPVGSGPPPSQRVTAERVNPTRSDNQEDSVAITIDENGTDDTATLETKSELQPEEGSVTTTPAGADTLDEDLGPDAVTVRILDLNGKFFSIPCSLDWRVARMKQRVLESTDVAVASQRLIYRGRVLEDDACLADYKVEDGHTIHLFVRHSPTPDPDALSAEALAGGSSGVNAATPRLDDASGLTIVHISNDLISSAVFPSDSARRVDPLMLDSALGNCARRVKLWSSFLLIIYTMKVMGQFALLANDQQLRSQQQQAAATTGDSGAAAAAAAAEREREDQRERMYDYPEYYHQDPIAGVVELLIHAFGVYVGGVGFKAAHDTDIRPIRFFCRGLTWLAGLTIAEQVYITVQIANSDIPNERIRFAYGAQAPSKDDIVSANIFQAIMLVVMWIIALRHAYWHQAEVNAYNQSFAAAAMNAVPPPRLPPAELA